jgi:hypothetical protein
MAAGNLLLDLTIELYMRRNSPTIGSKLGSSGPDMRHICM